MESILVSGFSLSLGELQNINAYCPRIGASKIFVAFCHL